MAASVVLGRDFQILPAHIAVLVLVLDAYVREMDLLIEVRQVVLTRPRLDLLDTPIWTAVAVAVAAIAFLEKPLIVAFQLSVEFDAQNACFARLQPLGRLQVRSIELRVVSAFPSPVSACVEGLAVV